MKKILRSLLLRQIGEAAAQEERNRLARDLHDSIKQQLFSINVGAATAQERWERDPEGAKAALADVRRSAKEAMVEMQALLHQLRPEALTYTGLVEALREQCEALGYRTGAQVTVELGEEIPDTRMPPSALEALFRIAQEALANVARHARAREVRLWVGRDRESAKVWIQDDGQGFDPGSKVSGMGLRNIKERADSLHGSLNVVSEPGEGTTVEVRIPLLPEPLPFMVGTGIEITLLLLVIFTFIGWPFIRPLLSNDDFGFIVVCYNFTYVALSSAGGVRRRTESALASSPGLSSAFSARLRYLSHRNRALAFFLAAMWLPWAWRLGKIWSGWTILCIGIALFCVGKAVAELVRLHRVSEVRPRWWSLRFLPIRILPLFSLIPRRVLLLFVLGYSIILIPVIAIFCIVLAMNGRPDIGQFLSYLRPHPLGAVEILCLVLGAALLLYIRTRRPSTEGAAA